MNYRCLSHAVKMRVPSMINPFNKHISISNIDENVPKFVFQ